MRGVCVNNAAQRGAGDCQRGHTGTWKLRPRPTLGAECVSLCQACSRCAAVSYSRFGDCQWVASCPSVRPTSRAYETVRVRPDAPAWPSPLLLLFYHAHKAAGTTITAWLEDLVRMNALDGHVAYHSASCYLHEQFPLLRRNRSVGAALSRCNAFQSDRLLGPRRTFEEGGWATSRVSVYRRCETPTLVCPPAFD